MTATTNDRATLIAALQQISSIAPSSDPPDLDTMNDLDPDQIEGICYDMGLYVCASIARDVLHSIGLEPEPGTTPWYDQGHEDDEQPPPVPVADLPARLRVQADNVEPEGHVSAARLMREAAAELEHHRARSG